MNRLDQFSESFKSENSLPGHDGPSTIRSAQKSAQAGRGKQVLFAPLHYEPKYAYPLIVWLHTEGENDAQINQVMPQVSMRNYAAVAPRGTFLHPSDASAEGFRKSPPQKGYAHDGRTWKLSDEGISAAEQGIFDSIALAQQRFNISPERIFLAGHSLGGTMAFRIGLLYPNQFAGVISLGGSFPRGYQSLVQLEEARRLPLLIAHPRDSHDYPVEQVCDDLRLFHSAGMSIALRQYPCGDGLTTQMLADMNTWLMERVTGCESPMPEPLDFMSPDLN